MIAQVTSITEDIIEKYEKKLLDKIINTHYFYFLNYEKIKIVEKALRRLEKNEDDAASLRLDIIREKLEEYSAELSEEGGPNGHTGNFPSAGSANPNNGFLQKTLEGFVRFRLREYYSLLETVVDDAAQEYLIEREYEEFIGLLKYFLSISESKIPLLHIETTDRGYRFFDNNRKDITYECLVDFLTPIDSAFLPETHTLQGFQLDATVEEEVNHDDMLISTLISLSPEKILWYRADEKSEIATTVKKIFENRVNIISR
ncbi:MAG: putative sporulation protein YtxC [Oscillospiraceae bacterium]|nr:putative sporulation protein YtxC [Oscillospiraceae bacterium]